MKKLDLGRSGIISTQQQGCEYETPRFALLRESGELTTLKLEKECLA
jgi:hypothetical protein